ncbi:hypothetical protein LCL87_10140 [Rhodococcus hoagii]|nr:hypothetical protein [Prescottella equi]
MALNDQEGRWVGRIQDASAIAASMADGMRRSGGAPLIRNFLSYLRQSPLGIAFDAAATDTPPIGSELELIVAPVIAALRDVFSGPEPSHTDDLVETLRKVAMTCHTAMTRLELADAARPHSVQSVIDDFERDYQVSLLATLTSQVGIFHISAEWERKHAATRGNAPGYLHIPSQQLVTEPGPGRVSMHVVNSAIDSGLVMMTPYSQSVIDRPPALQRILFGQWFTYIHATWEDVYRGRLAKAHGHDVDGNAWAKNDVRSLFFAEVALIRQDFAHHDGICNNSGTNMLLNWATEGEPIHGNAEQMLGLLNKFPRDELAQTPVRTKKKTLPLPWQLPAEFVDRLRQRVNRIPKKRRTTVLQEVLQAWLDDNP